MKFRLEWVVYERPLVIPLRTSRGDWFERRGIVLRLEREDGAVGYGEIAPLEAFGSETVEQAAAFLKKLGPDVDLGTLQHVPKNLPCCAFAIGSALWITEEPQVSYSLRNTCLLPTGEAAREALAEGREAGFYFYKLKIGVEEIHRELALVDALWSALPDGGRLRLDANGALSDVLAREWLHCLEGMDGVEFLEQPLPPGEEARMAHLSRATGVPIALDESVVHRDQLLALRETWGWSGPVVIKASILGWPADQVGLVSASGLPAVVSSAFETGIGVHAALRVASRLRSPFAIGFGTLGYFDDNLRLFELKPVLDDAPARGEGLHAVWQEVGQRYALT